MKLKTALSLVALACVGVSASAANVTDWGTLGPTPDVAYVTYHGTTGVIDDVYNFDIDATSDVDGYGEEFEARSVSMPGATFTLFSGTFGDPGATQVGAPMTFNNTATETVYASLATGNYYFEVTGTGALAGSAYDFEAFANESGPPASDVPEPANSALLVAGLAVIGFMLGRRKSQ